MVIVFKSLLIEKAFGRQEILVLVLFEKRPLLSLPLLCLFFISRGSDFMSIRAILARLNFITYSQGKAFQYPCYFPLAVFRVQAFSSLFAVIDRSIIWVPT